MVNRTGLTVSRAVPLVSAAGTGVPGACTVMSVVATNLLMSNSVLP